MQSHEYTSYDPFFNDYIDIDGNQRGVDHQDESLILALSSGVKTGSASYHPVLPSKVQVLLGKFKFR